MMLKAIGLAITMGSSTLSCSSSSPSSPPEPTYPGMCTDYYTLLQQEGNFLSREGKEWCEELCESVPVKDHYECATMYCCLKIKDCREGYWEKPEYIDCLASFGEKPYKL